MKSKYTEVKYKMVTKRDKYAMYQVGNVIYNYTDNTAYLVVKVEDKYSVISLEWGYASDKLFSSLKELADHYYSDSDELVDATLQLSPSLDNVELLRVLEDEDDR